MARRLQIKRGLLAEMPILAEGELGYATDTNELYIGTAEGVNVRTSPLFDEGITTKQVHIDGYGPEDGIFFDEVSGTKPIIYIGDYDETVVQNRSGNGAKLSLHQSQAELDAPDGLTIKLKDGNHELNFAYDVGDGNEAGMEYFASIDNTYATIATYNPGDKTFCFADGAIKVDSNDIEIAKGIRTASFIDGPLDVSVTLGGGIVNDEAGLVDADDKYLAVVTKDVDSHYERHHIYADGMIDANVDERTLEIEGYVKQEKYDELKQELDALKPTEWEEVLNNNGHIIKVRINGDYVEFNIVNPNDETTGIVTLPSKYVPSKERQIVYISSDDVGYTSTAVYKGEVEFDFSDEPVYYMGSYLLND